MSSALEARLEALERHVRELEDRLAIYQLVATYGPGVDTCTKEVVAGLWTEDGTYSASGAGTFEGAAGVAALVDSPSHQGYVERGCGHVLSLPHVTVAGDRAVATGYSQVCVRDGDHWEVRRASANRWELVRTPEGWRVQNRSNHVLDGSEASRDLLRRGVVEAG